MIPKKCPEALGLVALPQKQIQVAHIERGEQIRYGGNRQGLSASSVLIQSLDELGNQISSLCSLRRDCWCYPVIVEEVFD